MGRLVSTCFLELSDEAMDVGEEIDGRELDSRVFVREKRWSSGDGDDLFPFGWRS